jgi:translation initiation factor 1 (eIF-1/SUI1)
MEEFHQARANKRRERDIHICIKEMHTHMRETKLKVEEEEFKQLEEALKKREEKLRIREEQFENGKKMCYIISMHAVGSTLCIVISINICCNPNLFYVPYFIFL